jgi:hypothetical protein
MRRVTEFEYDLEPGHTFVAVRLETRKGKLAIYRIVLVVVYAGIEHTVRVYDNVHGRHDLHRHTLSGGKQASEVAHFGTPAEAAAAAELTIKRGYKEMIAGWLR